MSNILNSRLYTAKLLPSDKEKGARFQNILHLGPFDFPKGYPIY